MNLIDSNITYILKTITGLREEDIYNYYDTRGANPEKIITNSEGKRETIPYSPKQDTYIMFGVEEVDTGNESYIVTPGTGGPEGKITITQKFKVVIELNGKYAQVYALKIKALMWRWDIMEYLEQNNISVLTQNPEIQFMDEIVNEEMWERRGLTFEVVVELNYDESEIPEFENLSKVNVVDLENIKEENND